MSAVDGRYGPTTAEPATYRCSCMETVYVHQRARHEAKDHLTPEAEYETIVAAMAVSMTDAEFARHRRLAARVTIGHFGDIWLTDRFGDEARFVDVARARQDVGLATPGWSRMSV